MERQITKRVGAAAVRRTVALVLVLCGVLLAPVAQASAAPPTVTGLSPEKGPAAGGTVVTITGEHLAGATEVKFGATAATIKSDTETKIEATAPPGNGKVPVTVSTPGGNNATGPEYTYIPAPTVTSLNPESGPAEGGTVVTINGTHLAGATEVKFGATTATIKSDTETKIEATAPAGTGTVEVTVTTAGGTSKNGDAYTYIPPPIVTSIAPPEGSTAGGTVVTITGEHLLKATEVKFGATVGTINSDTETKIEATAPAGTGTVEVTVTTKGGTSRNGDQFRYVAPSSGSSGGAGSGGSTSSTSSAPASTATTPKTTASPPPIRVPVALVSLLHSRLIHGSTLEVRFTLAVKARARLVARRGHRIVASTLTRTFKAGACRMLLKLERKHWPTKLELQTHPLVALPTILRAA